MNSNESIENDSRPDLHGINPLILTRWSSRSYLVKAIPENDLLGVLEAARWAPSCFNEQPWRFIVARTETDLKVMQSCLNDSNLAWANKAPVLIGVISAPEFHLDGRLNRWNAFDAGTAWGFLALEAHRRGLTAHAMGGFSQTHFREVYSIPENWGIHAVVALGYRGGTVELPNALREKEMPSSRKSLNEIWNDGVFRF